MVFVLIVAFEDNTVGDVGEEMAMMVKGEELLLKREALTGVSGQRESRGYM